MYVNTAYGLIYNYAHMTWRTAVKFIGTFSGKGRHFRWGPALTWSWKSRTPAQGWDTCPGLRHRTWRAESSESPPWPEPRALQSPRAENQHPPPGLRIQGAIRSCLSQVVCCPSSAASLSASLPSFWWVRYQETEKEAVIKRECVPILPIKRGWG